MKLRLKPVKPKRISDQVFDQLRELIIRGDLKPGERLMPERELCEALGVSRTSIREAINKLVILGFLDQRQGQGTYVLSLEDAEILPLATVMETQDASVVDLLEVRRGLESNAAAMAAQRAKPEDIELIEKRLHEMEKDTREGGLGTEGDVGFHMAIANATGNPLQVYIMKSVIDFLFIGIRENLLHLYEIPENVVTILKQHLTIYEAIKNQDASGAYQAMLHHIDFVIAYFKNLENTD